jgi:hypothetical protein
MQQQMEEFISTLNQELASRARPEPEVPQNSLIPVVRLTPLEITLPKPQRRR